jgi:hypothetical protein
MARMNLEQLHRSTDAVSLTKDEKQISKLKLIPKL